MNLDAIEKKKEEIKAEIDVLKHEFKVELPKKIAEAREHGDLKENADYHAARERQGFVKAKISQLNSELATLKNINLQEIPTDCIGFGSSVEIQNVDSNEIKNITFVTDAESNPSEGKITLATPFGSALNGKHAGAEVQIQLPMGVENYRILKIKTIHGNELSA